MPQIKVKLLHPNAKVPQKGSAGAACYDIFMPEKGVVGFRPEKHPTGLAFEVPEGYFLDVRIRSSLGLKGVSLGNVPATLDSDYRGELFLELYHHYACCNYEYAAGERLAQCRIVKCEPTEFVQSETLSETVRGAGGYGHSGRTDIKV